LATSERTVDVLVIGAGAAGLAAALAATRAGAEVMVAAAGTPGESHSVKAVGGMNGVFDREADWREHVHDTLRVGDGLADRAAVERMCASASEVVAGLLSDGVEMRRELLGRTAHWQYTLPDITGLTIVEALAGALERSGAQLRWGVRARALAVSGGGCRGAWLASGRDELHVRASAVVLATGGYGALLSPSIAAAEADGSGLGLAYAAGAELMDMEFVQFHPTVAAGSPVLVSERARGAGARLLNGLGERFMERYDPERCELAPRALVSQAIDEELRAGRGCPEGGVLLDFAAVPAENWQHIEFVRRELARAVGVDVRERPVRVEPAVHYTMGGVAVGLDGRTNVPGLWAAGEAACVSVHGANRLGGNSLLDATVFGTRAGVAAAATAGDTAAAAPAGSGATAAAAPPGNPATEGAPAASGAAPPGDTPRPERAPDYRVGPELRALLGRCAGIRRDGDALAEGLATLRASWERDRQPAAAIAAAIVASALAREESRGAHQRTDHPMRDDERWLAHSVVRRGADGFEPELSLRAVDAAVPAG
jgi:succinate dehydrogenase/fumarate reductase flavoprotein subunit